MRFFLIFSFSFMFVFLLLNCILPFTLAKQGEEFVEIEENDFAEFDFQDETEENANADKGDDDEFIADDDKDDMEAEVSIEEDGPEFNPYDDEEEFVGFNDKDDSEEFLNEKKPARPPKEPKLTYPEIHMMRSNWENYYVEIFMIIGIVIYFINFFSGKNKNQKIANQWFNSHRTLLESQFSLVGDDGAKNVEEIQEPLTKECENIFTFWCSGRICCEGMLVELKLIKRQDLVGVIANSLKPQYDQVHIRVEMSPEDMDTFIFCIASKKSAQRLCKEMNDLNTYCPEKRPADKYDIPGSYYIMSEVAEVAAAMLDSKLVSMFKKYPEVIDTIHFSDQFTGPKPADEQQPSDMPPGKPVLIFVFNILNGTEAGIEDTKPLLHLVFYCLDKVKRYKLSREAKNKADKNRTRVAENRWRSIHAAKAEKAAEDREKRRREVKERIKEIEDPEKQRKMEERENKREKKKMQPKMKQLKVKSM